MVLTAASCSPRCAGFLATVSARSEASSRPRQRACARCAGHQHRDARTVRLDRSYQGCSSAQMITLQPRYAHRVPRSTSVTIAIRPSSEAGRRQSSMISVKKKEKYFARRAGQGDRFERLAEINFSAQRISRSYTAARGAARDRYCPTGESPQCGRGRARRDGQALRSLPQIAVLAVDRQELDGLRARGEAAELAVVGLVFRRLR